MKISVTASFVSIPVDTFSISMEEQLISLLNQITETGERIILKQLFSPNWRAGFSGLRSRVRCVRPLSLFDSDASADGVEERSLVPRSRSHARLRRNMTMSHAFLCVQPAYDKTL
ncbi:hypothetical protein EVAR_45239_1 [Eumeta japonica]|uniref:Uncharacterized protein n=1 Tax=Eumeta variegata TaxID=151549 RepID=A0A4C1XBF3_EUMVA|nr:hypothetical protein EVAR_45239_1 [Eumeta japonica]